MEDCMSLKSCESKDNTLGREGGVLSEKSQKLGRKSSWEEPQDSRFSAYSHAGNLAEIFGNEINSEEKIYWLVRDSGEIEEASGVGSLSLLHIPKEEFVGRHIISTIFSEDCELLRREMDSPEEGKIFRVPIRKLNREGEPIQMDMMATFVQINEGVKRWLFCDTFLKEGNKRLHKDEALRRASSLEFGIRQPCQVFKGSLDLMRELISEIARDDRTSQDVREKAWRVLHLAELMEEESVTLKSLVDNFSLWEELKYSGLDRWSGKEENFILFDRLRGDLIRQRKKFEDIHIRVEQRLEFAENRVVAVAELVIDRILENLFDHILQIMSRKRDPSNHLMIKSREEVIDGRTVRLYLQVIASGVAMIEEHRMRMFIPFALEGDYRLPVVGKIVNLFGGRISYEENEGSGVTFHIEIPFSVGEETLATRPPLEALAVKELPIRIPSQKKVMFADDREKQRELMGMWLERKQYSYDICADGEEVIRKVEAGETYSVYVLDYKMPRLDGVETAKRLRQLNIRSPIILVSGAGLELSEKELEGTGINELWKKPVNIKKLLDHVSTL